jgi:murein DD-endopeptidase MepM/ murein hydrolase activator NlpD
MWPITDTIVPKPGDPQSLNRYSYVLNNPLRFVDPSGYWYEDPQTGALLPGDPPSPPPPVPTNPWILPDLNDDGVVTAEDELLGRQLYGSMAEELFLHEMKPPYTSFWPFGGCNTLDGCAFGYHAAVDSRNSRQGAPIYATAYGKVVAVTNSDFGDYVLIEHNIYGNKFYSVYAHLQTQSVAVNDIVDTFTQIGTMGNTGTNIVHLHFEVRKATNVNLATGVADPVQGRRWWATTEEQFRQDFVDLGPVFGYHNDFPWSKRTPIPL